MLIKLCLQGKVDAASEIDKLEKKQVLAEGTKEKLGKVIGQANYETTVKEEVRSANTERVGRLLVYASRPTDEFIVDGEDRHGDRDTQTGNRAVQVALVEVTMHTA